MFQTITVKGGLIQLTTIGNKTTIAAWSHGELLGDKYTTVSGALGAITRHHKEWVKEGQTSHYSSCYFG